MEITKFMKMSYKTGKKKSRRSRRGLKFVELIIKKQKEKKNDVGNG